MSTTEKANVVPGQRYPVAAPEVGGEPGAGDVPVHLAANLTPASIDVQSNLAEDTVIAEALDIAEGKNKVAMFANPFTGGSEELLYIDEQGTLRWARHVNRDGDTDPGGLSGWSVEPVALKAQEVVITVNPDGTVWAVVLIPGGREPNGHTRDLWFYYLGQNPAVPGAVSWGVWYPEPTPGSVGGLRGLQVQYCNDRPATPVVFLTQRAGDGATTLFWWLPMIRPTSLPDINVTGWSFGGSAPLDKADWEAKQLIAMVDSPDQVFTQRRSVRYVEIYTLTGGQLVHSLYDAVNQVMKYRVPVSSAVDGLLGPWTHPHGGGVVGYHSTNPGPSSQDQLALYTAENYGWLTHYLDRPLQDMAIWQDADLLLHVYGRDADGTLCVVHQTGWVEDTSQNAFGMMEPVWETHLAFPPPLPPGYELAARPLVADVATFVLDAYPDEMPNQFVRHQGEVPSGESSALYTQGVRTSFWHEEKMRLVPDTLPKPYTVPRYETTLTVRNAYGTPIAGCQVNLTADVPVDLEVAGGFYRTGTVTPVHLVTNASGQVTLRVVANALAVPQLHVTVPGMAQSVTVQMASDVHKFLAGNGTLPNHGDGFTAATVTNAKQADGKTPLFPGIKRTTDDDDDWPPSADDVVTWCRGAFAVDAGTPLPAAMRAGVGEGEQVLAFTLQTHDPSRPGFQVYTRAEQLTARRDALRDAGILDELDSWFGDVWQGIRQDVIDVAEAVVNLVDQTIELVIELANEVKAIFICAWDDIVSAAHAVEAVFVAIGAKIEEVVNWLKWAFDFKDALLTAKAMESAVRGIKADITQTLVDFQGVVDGWFVAKESEVTDWFDDMKSSLAGRPVGMLESPLAVPSGTKLSPKTAVDDHLTGPHANWLTEKVLSSPTSEPQDLPSEEDDLFDEIWGILTDAKAWQGFDAAARDAGQLFTNLFDGNDPQTFVAKELVTLLTVFEDVVLALLQYADDVVDKGIAWGLKALDQLENRFDTPLTDVPIIEALWDFMVGQAKLDPKDYPLTAGMLGMFVGAYPATLIYKIVEGSAPFPDGVFPTPPAPGHRGGNEALDPAAVYRLHVFMGVVRGLDVVWNTAINLNCLNPVRYQGATALGSVGVGPEGPSSVLARSFTFLHVFSYGVGEAPWLLGRPASQANAPAYFRWGTLTIFALADAFAAVKYGSALERFRVSANWQTSGTGVFICSAVGLASCLTGFWELNNANARKDPCWYDTRNAVMSIAGGVPLLLSMLRSFYDATRSVPAGLLVVGSMFIDAIADLYRGGSLVEFAGYELNNPVEITGDSPRVLTPATVFIPYESERVSATKGLPRYAWEVLKTDAQPGLPPGLEIISVPGSPDYPGSEIAIVGTPTLDGEYQFTLRVQDNYYGPQSTADVTCSITVAKA